MRDVLFALWALLGLALCIWVVRLVRRYRETAPREGADTPIVLPARPAAAAGGPEAAPPRRSRRGPGSPWLEAEPHPHPWRLPLLVSAAIVVVAGAVWFAELRPRADAATVQEHVALTHPGATIGCSQRTVNASQFDCAVVYSADSECVAVSVSMQGSVSRGRPAHSACAVPQLERLLTWPPTPQLVAADVTRLLGGNRFVCARTSPGGTRFACARATAQGYDCQIVRVARWTPMKPRRAGGECRRVHALKTAVMG